MKHKLLDFRTNQRPDDVLDFLKANFPTVKFSTGLEEIGDRKVLHQYVYTDTELNDEQAKEVYQKLKLTSLHFVDRNRYVYN